MAKYYLTKKAVEDLTEIWNYTFDQWSEKQADIYYQILLANFLEIADDPNLGKNYDEITTDVFGLKINRHIIFYRKIQEKEIEITRILHGRMDLKNRIIE
jgi:toxin ParE1/3/4